MGLLDDAIREHLELKRRRGADPGEVAREEREALTPPVTTRGAWAAAAAEQHAQADGGRAPAPEAAPAGGDAVAPAGVESERDAFAGTGGFGGVERPAPGVEAVGTTQETVEIDMEHVLAQEGTPAADGHGAASSAGQAGAAEGGAAQEEELFEWETPAGRADAIADDQAMGEQPVPEQIPGQERMPFE